MSSKRILKLAQQDVNDAVRGVLANVRESQPFSDVVCVDEAAYMGLHESYGALQIVMNNLDQIDAPASKRDTSIAAAKSVLPGRNTLLRTVLDKIVFRHHITRGHDGLTCDQVEQATSRLHTSVSSAINALEEREFIRDSGDRRLTRSKRKAIVWVPTDKALDMHKADRFSDTYKAG